MIHTDNHTACIVLQEQKKILYDDSFSAFNIVEYPYFSIDILSEKLN